jgi:formylglycine-generating enzyme required for sulfatase activity
VDPADLPLAVGGRDSDVRLPGVHGDAPQLYIGLDHKAVFAQPADDAIERLVCGGSPLTTSRWIEDGDLLEIGEARLAVRFGDQGILFEVLDPAADNPTEPPRIAPATTGAPPADAQTTITPVEFTPRRTGASRRPGWRPSPGLVIEAVLLLLLAAAVWFVFTARSVSVEVDPLPDRIALRGGLPAVRIAGRYLVRPGRYTVVAEREGYKRLSQPVEVTRASGQRFRYVLEQLPGRLNVSVAGVKDSQVFVDGRRVGVAPVEGVELTPGEHRVEIRAERYQEYSTDITIDGPGTEQTLEAELVAAWAAITITSEPARATVTVNGTEIGQTPVTAEIMAGTHAVELMLRGHKPHRLRVGVVANQPQTLPTVRLDPSDGNLNMSSDPSEATVTVDGVFKGRTPIDLLLTPGATHVVEVSKAGFEAHAEEVRVTPDEHQSLRVALEPRVGEVAVFSRPPNAELFVDGEPVGRTGQTLRLVALPHQIEVRKKGYQAFQTTVTPKPGLPQSIEVTLPSSAAAAVQPAVITSPQDVELRLIPAGRFTMGASRREPGRRANETLREVELTRPFYLAVREVSNREFRAFKKGHLSGGAGTLSLETDHHPVVRITWEDAARYCNWLSEQQGLPPVYVERSGTLVARTPFPTGYRLPTEAEWAWAARVPDGTNTLKYPWGNALPVAPGSDNYGDRSALALLDGAIPDYDDSHPGTAPVGSFEANARGLFNMGGNVSEWVHDIYTIYPPAPGTLSRDPSGPAEGEYHVIRGASWMDDSVTELRLSYRDYGNEPRPDVGFRIARSVVEVE